MLDRRAPSGAAGDLEVDPPRSLRSLGPRRHHANRCNRRLSLRRPSKRIGGYSVGRYYDPTTGQFLTVDPLVDQTESPYAYVNGDPVDGADPLGLGCLFGICTHSFDPSASLDAIVNIGRGATFGLTDRIANWIVPGASCTVAQNSLDQFIGNAATTLLGGEALDALLESGRVGDLLARVRAVDWADETGAIGPGDLGFARAVRLPVDNPAVANRGLSVADFVAQFRKASVLRELPGEFLDKTVEQALRSGDSTVRKLLISGEYAK